MPATNVTKQQVTVFANDTGPQFILWQNPHSPEQKQFYRLELMTVDDFTEELQGALNKKLSTT